jgi:hypothetical protein
MVVNSEVVWLKNDPSMDAVAMPEDKVDEQSLREIQSGNVNALQETVDFSETTNESTSDASDAQEEASAEDTEFGGAGLRFAGMDGDQKERINEFIRRNIRQDLH